LFPKNITNTISVVSWLKLNRPKICISRISHYILVLSEKNARFYPSKLINDFTISIQLSRKSA